VLKKRVVIAMISIAVISFLIGTTLNVMALASYGGNPFDKIWEAIYDLQDRVNTLEESIDSKTWHSVTSFTLTYEERVSPLFSIQGEKWRIKWEPLEVSSWPGFIIWDENGFAIEEVQVNMILGQHHEAKGIHYMAHGEGSYYIEHVPGPTVDFTIESYH